MLESAAAVSPFLVEPGAASRLPRSRHRLKRVGFWCAFWTLLVFVYSLPGEVRFEQTSWWTSLKWSMAQFYVWAALAPAIIAIDRRLPVPPDALLRRFVLHVPFAVVMGMVYTYLNLWFSVLIDAPHDSWQVGGGVLATLLRSVNRPGTFAYWVVLALHSAFEYRMRVKDKVIQTAELENLLAESRLTTLRAQLHPHFLFNALNTVSACIDNSPQMARRMLEQVSDLLRLSLAHASQHEIPLNQELAFIGRYLDVQKARFEDRLAAVVRPESGALHALVPAFILQPLVENAIHHGVASRSDRSTVEVSATAADGRLHLRVQDDGPGLPVGWDAERSLGVGLSNTRERLRRLYGDSNHCFEIHGRPQGGVEVTVILPLRFA